MKNANTIWSALNMLLVVLAAVVLTACGGGGGGGDKESAEVQFSFQDGDGNAELTGSYVLASPVNADTTDFGIGVPVDSDTASVWANLYYWDGSFYSSIGSGFTTLNPGTAQTASVAISLSSPLEERDDYYFDYTLSPEAMGMTSYSESWRNPGTYTKSMFGGDEEETGVTLHYLSIPNSGGNDTGEPLPILPYVNGDGIAEMTGPPLLPDSVVALDGASFHMTVPVDSDTAGVHVQVESIEGGYAGSATASITPGSPQKVNLTIPLQYGASTLWGGKYYAQVVVCPDEGDCSFLAPSFTSYGEELSSDPHTYVKSHWPEGEMGAADFTLTLVQVPYMSVVPDGDYFTVNGTTHIEDIPNTVCSAGVIGGGYMIALTYGTTTIFLNTSGSTVGSYDASLGLEAVNGGMATASVSLEAYSTFNNNGFGTITLDTVGSVGEMISGSFDVTLCDTGGVCNLTLTGSFNAERDQ